MPLGLGLELIALMVMVGLVMGTDSFLLATTTVIHPHPHPTSKVHIYQPKLKLNAACDERKRHKANWSIQNIYILVWLLLSFPCTCGSFFFFKGIFFKKKKMLSRYILLQVSKWWWYKIIGLMCEYFQFNMIHPIWTISIET